VVLLPNAGSTHHVGPSRLYVLLARRLAQAGFRCVRFDLPGLGDSVTGNRDDENNPYVPEASLAIASVIKAVSGKNADAYVLMGLCSGAHTAFHAALDLDRSPIVESILINPLTFYYTPGMSLDQPAWHNGAGWRRFVQAVGSSQSLARLFSTDISRIASALSVQLRTIVTETMENLNLVGGKTRADRAGAGDLAADITRLVARQRRLTFVFSMHDPGYHLLMSMARKVVKPLRRQGAVKLWIIKGANHTFEQKIPREEMIDSIVAHLTANHPPAQAQRRQAAV
jgi:pimeloyl-ACP methyl ester carboxylesterase